MIKPVDKRASIDGDQSGSRFSCCEGQQSEVQAVQYGSQGSQSNGTESTGRLYMEEAARLALESVQKGWGGPFGAVIVKDGQIIGRGQNRVLLTGVPIYHAEMTAILDACQRLNPKAYLGADQAPGTTLELVSREPGSDDPAPARARMLKGCDMYITAVPCPMCMSAIYWARIDRVFIAANLDDASQAGFDDAFQYQDFRKPFQDRRIEIITDYERALGMQAFEAWQHKSDRHPY